MVSVARMCSCGGQRNTLKWVPSFRLHVGSRDGALVIRSDQPAFSATEPSPRLSELFLKAAFFLKKTAQTGRWAEV